MSDTIIKLENISKQYRLGQIGTKTMRGDLQRWWYNVRGKEDPTLKIGSCNKLDAIEGEYVWALKDINLEVKQGEILGVIGKNGAGKSTLLKLLSRVTSPTTGQIKVKGRIASLLEVGTGFHPELTGRENIFLNGAIMGMTKAEIKSKFDEIIDFSGVAKYVDTPVKRYSSGMYVRLAFAVAAYLEPDILIVDEVLAVGDAEFQKKAIGKMQDVSSGGGRTVLFVSHNMKSISRLCSKTALFSNGELEKVGLTDSIIDYYLNLNRDATLNLKKIISGLPNDLDVKIHDIAINQIDGKDLVFKSHLSINIIIEYEIFNEMYGFRIVVDLRDEEETILFRSFHDADADEVYKTVPGLYISRMEIPANLLGDSNYIVAIKSGIHNVRWCFQEKEITIPIKSMHTGSYNRAYPTDHYIGKFGLNLKWETEKKLKHEDTN